MPAFTFEKISPPRRGPIAPIVKKQRGLVVAGERPCLLQTWLRRGESNTRSLVPKTSAFPLGYSPKIGVSSENRTRITGATIQRSTIELWTP